MRVNDGSLVFDMSKNADMKSLLFQVYRAAGNSQQYSKQRVSEVFHEDGKNRYKQGSISVVSSNEISNTYDDVLSNINADWKVARIMKAISLWQSKQSKQVMLVVLTIKGYHVLFKEVFELLVDINSIKNGMDNPSEELIKQVIADNIELNGYLKEFSDSIHRSLDTARKTFFAHMTKYLTPAGIAILEKDADLLVDQGHSVIIDHIRGELLKPEYLDAVRDELTRYRDFVNRTTYPTQKDTCRNYRIAETTYRSRRLEVMNSLMNLFGSDMTNDIVTR